MSAAWAAVLLVGVGTIALKSVGPVGVAGRRLPARVDQLLEMVGPAILAALVVTSTFANFSSPRATLIVSPVNSLTVTYG